MSISHAKKLVPDLPVLSLKKPYNEMDKTNNKDSDKVITALVTFERGDSVRARFTFELSSDNDDYNTDRVSNSINKKIKTLHIQFTK